MAYTALVNGEEFFKTDSDDDIYELVTANLHLASSSAGTFEFTVPNTNKFFRKFTQYRSFIDVYRDGDEKALFSGRVVNLSTGFNTFENVYCEGALSYLSDAQITGAIEFSGDASDLISRFLTEYNNSVEAEKKIKPGFIHPQIATQHVYRKYEKYEDALTRFFDLNKSLGGYIEVARSSEDNELYLNWYNHYTNSNSQSIKLGVNLLDITIDDNDEDICTVLIPFGAKIEDSESTLDTAQYVTIKSVNDGSDRILATQEYINQYGYITRIEHWDDVTEPANLKRKAEASLAARLVPKRTIKVRAVDLADASLENIDDFGTEISHFKIGQKIKVNTPVHGVDEFFDCCEQDLDLLNPANNALTLGGTVTGYIQAHTNNAVSALVNSITAKYLTKDVMEAAVNRATELITGNSGGYIVLYDSDNDTKPDELLCMDQMSIETAVKVWRLNNSGFGYSDNGYEGPYRLAMTMEGAINADFITVGTLSANIIRAGVLQSLDGSSYWNLETGDVLINGYKKSADVTTEINTAIDTATGTITSSVAQTYETKSDASTKLQSAKDYAKGYSDDNLAAAKDYSDANLATAQSSITQTANTIRTEVSNTYETKVNVQSSIEQLAGQISSKVEITDYTGAKIASMINQSATTVYIQAGHIKLEGITTVNEGFSIDENGYMRIRQKSNAQEGSIYLGEGTWYYNRSSSLAKIGPALIIQNKTNGYADNTAAKFQIYPNNTSGMTSNTVIASNRDIAFDFENPTNSAKTYTFQVGSQGILYWARNTTENPNGGTFRVGVEGSGIFHKSLQISTYVSSSSGWRDTTISGNTLSTNNGTFTVNGSLAVTGTKPRLVTTDNYDKRLLYCYETPEPMFGDLGEGETDDDGVCYISIDDVFSETVNTILEYQVFLQTEGVGSLYVGEKAKTYFVVKGTPNLKFSWEVKAKQRDFVLERLEEPSDYYATNEREFEDIYGDELTRLINEQETILEEDSYEAA